MKNFNLKKYLLENPLTKNKKVVNEAFEGFGGVKGIAPIQEAPSQPKDFKTTTDPWGWDDHVKNVKNDEENRANKWMMNIDRYPNPYKDWSVSWEYPGIIVWSHPDISDMVVVATPQWDGPGTPVELQLRNGESRMLEVIDQDDFPNMNAYIKAVSPYLDMIEKKYSEATNMMKEKHSDLSQDGMGLPIKPVIHPDDMNEDYGYDEDEDDFDPRQLSSFERMNGLVNQNNLKMFVTGARGIMGDLLDDGFEPDEVYEFLLDTLKNVD